MNLLRKLIHKLMACKKCKSSVPCGCEDTPYVTYTVPSDCNPKPVCSDVIPTGCVIYNGPELTLYGIVPGMTMNEVLQRILIGATNPECVTSDGSATCLSPILTVISVTTTSIDIGWSLVPDVTVDYYIEWSDGITGGTASVGPTITHYKITDLDPNTEYSIRVDTDCSPGSCQSLFIKVKTNAS